MKIKDIQGQSGTIKDDQGLIKAHQGSSGLIGAHPYQSRGQLRPIKGPFKEQSRRMP
jgi:hypothetical protein